MLSAEEVIKLFNKSWVFHSESDEFRFIDDLNSFITRNDEGCTRGFAQFKDDEVNEMHVYTWLMRDFSKCNVYYCDNANIKQHQNITDIISPNDGHDKQYYFIECGSIKTDGWLEVMNICHMYELIAYSNKLKFKDNFMLEHDGKKYMFPNVMNTILIFKNGKKFYYGYVINFPVKTLNKEIIKPKKTIIDAIDNALKTQKCSYYNNFNESYLLELNNDAFLFVPHSHMYYIGEDTK